MIDNKEIKRLTSLYFTNDEPVPYRLKNGVTIYIYPITVRDYYVFNACVDILKMNKNEISSSEVIRMSYLEFLLHLIKEDKNEENEISKRLSFILQLCLHEESVAIDKIKGKVYLVALEESKNQDAPDIKYIISHSEFDDIKKIVLYQNIYTYEDVELSKDVRKVMDDYYRATTTGQKEVTLEEQMAFLSNCSGLRKSDLLSLTYREFNMRFDMAVEQIEYEINKSAELFGNVKFKTKVEHFIYKRKHDMLEKFFVDGDEVRGKIE